MRQSQSAVIERGFELDGTHATEPFEVAWAGEARWFVHFLVPAPGSRVRRWRGAASRCSAQASTSASWLNRITCRVSAICWKNTVPS